MFKFKNSTLEHRVNSACVRERIDRLLKGHYQACTTDKLPPRLLAILKRFDEERPESGEHVQVIPETKI